MQQCPNCEKEISRAAATKCPHCGMPLGHTPPLSTGARRANRSRASTLILLLGISIVFFLYLIESSVLSAREFARRSACFNNLKQLGLALDMYANENGGRFPPIDNSRNNFVFEGDLLYPEYLADAAILAYPSDPETNAKTNFRLISNHPDGTPAGQVHPDCITNMSYSYLGWMVMTDKETDAFFGAYDDMSSEDFDKDITVPEGSGNAEVSVLHRLSADVERFLIPNPDILIQSDEPIVVGEVNFPSTVPIMWDQISTDITEFNHVPAGQNVLYLDGHVEYYRYDLNSTQFPTSPLTGALFDARPRERIPHCEE